MDPLTGKPRTAVINLINANSPMTFDETMLGAAKVYARANQACIITPFILAGAMSPVTVAGTAAQTLAEALAGMAFVQLCSPGAPVVLGSFASSISMQSGAPTFGTPEPALVLYAMAALARRLGVPLPFGRWPVRFRRSRMPKPPPSRPTPCCPPAWPASTLCCTPQAGSKAACPWATRSSSWTWTRPA